MSTTDREGWELVSFTAQVVPAIPPAYQWLTMPDSYQDRLDPYLPEIEGFGFATRPHARATHPPARVRALTTRAGRRTIRQRLRSLLPRADFGGLL